MEDKTVSYLVFESSQTRSDRIIHRLIVGILISGILLFVSNALWLYAWFQYDYVSGTTIDNTNGTSNYIGENGVIENGNDN